MAQKHKYIGKSERFKKVFEYKTNKLKTLWAFQRNKIGAFYEDERKCALALDLYLIHNGEEPINVLKRK